MILVDTSVWVDHLHRGDEHLVGLLARNVVACHPLVVGELALGSIRDRTTVLDLLRGLHTVTRADDAEVLTLVEQHRLHGIGLSLVGAHLLASVRLTPGAALWTRDKRLAGTADQLGISWRS